MKRIITLLSLVSFTLISMAQEQPPAAVETQSTEKDMSIDEHTWGVSLNLTTNGLGGEISRSILKNQKLIARLGGNYLGYELNGYQANFSGTKIIANGKLQFGSVGAYIDWHPFGNAFKLTGGVAYMMSSVSGNANLKDSTKQGDIMISPEEVGKINIEIKPSSFTPYIGIGFGRAIPKRRVGVSFEIGTYYIGSPTVNFTTTKMLEPTSSQGKVLSDNLSGYQWLPKLSLSINIKLTK